MQCWFKPKTLNTDVSFSLKLQHSGRGRGDIDKYIEYVYYMLRPFLITARFYNNRRDPIIRTLLRLGHGLNLRPNLTFNLSLSFWQKPRPSLKHKDWDILFHRFLSKSGLL